MSSGDLPVERISFDYKAPSFSRVGMEAGTSGEPGRFATSNGTYTSWYDSQTHTYDISSAMNLSREYDYQLMVRNVISDRNFTILEHNTTGGQDRYLIEVVTDPWSDRYTPYISSRVRAWIEPSTGLAWEIATYYDWTVAGEPTFPPGMILPTMTPPQKDMVQSTNITRSEVPDRVVRYESIEVNSGIPDSYFEFVPPAGSGTRCVPKYTGYAEPPRMDPSVPINEPLPGGLRYSFNESDSGRAVTLQTGEVLEITLPTIPGLTFRWMMPTEGYGLELLNAGPIYEMPEGNDFLGGKGYYRWRFRAVEQGTTTFDGIFALSGCDIQDARRFNLTVKVMA